MKGTPLLLIASLALGACSLGPDFTRPDRPAPGEWSLQAAAGNPSHLAAAPLAAQWWTLFDDAQLNALLQRVQRANLDLRSAAARLQQSRAIRRSLGGDALPSVDASGNYQRQRTTSAGLFDPSGKAGKGNYNHALAGFDASWELDFWGRVRRELEAADATVEASENELRDVQVSVLAEAARDYIQLRGEQNRAAIIRDNLETARRSLELTRTRLANGVATDLEVAQALAQVASMEARLPEVEKNQAHLVNALGYLVGASPGSLLAELGPARAIPRPPGSVPVGLPSELAQRRPDIRRAEARLHAATASIGVAKADFYPRITLNGNFVSNPCNCPAWATGTIASSPSARRSACRSSKADACADAWSYARHSSRKPPSTTSAPCCVPGRKSTTRCTTTPPTSAARSASAKPWRRTAAPCRAPASNTAPARWTSSACSTASGNCWTTRNSRSPATKRCR